MRRRVNRERLIALPMRTRIEEYVAGAVPVTRGAIYILVDRAGPYDSGRSASRRFETSSQAAVPRDLVLHVQTHIFLPCHPERECKFGS